MIRMIRVLVIVILFDQDDLDRAIWLLARPFCEEIDERRRSRLLLSPYFDDLRVQPVRLSAELLLSVRVFVPEGLKAEPQWLSLLLVAEQRRDMRRVLLVDCLHECKEGLAGLEVERLLLGFGVAQVHHDEPADVLVLV